VHAAERFLLFATCITFFMYTMAHYRGFVSRSLCLFSERKTIEMRAREFVSRALAAKTSSRRAFETQDVFR